MADQGAVQKMHGWFVSVVPWFCTAKCTDVIGKYEVYADWGHVTTEYAEYLSGAMQASLQPVLKSVITSQQ
jgi:hypothetical protein